MLPQDPHVVIQAITLLDACVNNCGKAFKLEVASASFEADFKKLLAKWKVEPRVHDKLKSMLKKWAENDFKGEPQLALIPALYSSLMKGGVDFRSQSEPGKHKGAFHYLFNINQTDFLIGTPGNTQIFSLIRVSQNLPN